ncbi:MAG TPA: bifunctional aspartate kinase/diaminopimelate decarboxylase [Gammaproteobacteria bacterium]|nr:bifunctional aspartate kinase/diaminopimelate decarboxylase [Gammaproteobacteria bacterium]
MHPTMEPWIVIKLGGVSVSQARYWNNVIETVRNLRRLGKRVLIVQSALAGVTNALEAVLTETAPAERRARLEEVAAQHAALAAEMTISVDAELAPLYAALHDEAAALPAEVPPAARARILAAGELLASRLGAAYLRHCGLPAALVDARDWLRADPLPNQPLHAQYLSASCAARANADAACRLADVGEVVLTQGFVAANAAGETVLLGRGGSDTSAAYFAAMLGAECLEIWTDVPGLFSADPREVPSARLLKQVDYDEAQEISTTGAKVLHPRCIGPARAAGIPIRIRCTADPGLPGTLIGAQVPDRRGRVKAISVRRDVTLVCMETVGMWHQVGFLADAFACFKRQGLSVDLVSTSETNVTVSLDPLANVLTDAALTALLDELGGLCQARTLRNCATISLVGRQMRANLHRLAPALGLFEQRRVHLLSQAANDLNFTFVVDQADAARLVRELHGRLVQPVANDPVLGPSWEELSAPPPAEATTPPWWTVKRERLLALAGEATPLYVYDLDSVRAAALRLLDLEHADRIFFSIKANHHPAILSTVHDAGLGFECVAPAELARVRELFPDLSAERLLYTPNFAPRSDYGAGFDAAAQVTLDNLYPLREWPALFRGRPLFLRVDPGQGAGHHEHVRTAGQYSKFGIPIAELPLAAELAAAAGARVVGLHAHVGSGIFDADRWRDTGATLAKCAAHFSDVKVLDLGGGLGVPENAGQAPLDLTRLDAALQMVKALCPGCEVWLEPGRYLVAAAGVLLARVTQTKGKGETRYIGVNTGMNSLIRPALYGAWHPIVNLSRLDAAAAGTFDVVGPICETGDILGRSRLLPEPHEGDVMLIGNAGAYGSVMASNYNLRQPAEQAII